MELHTFSNSLSELYEAAENASPNEFPKEVVRIVNTLICFDGALLGTGLEDVLPKSGLMNEQAYLHNRHVSMLTDYAQISTIDPIAETFAKGLSKPLGSDCKKLYQERELDELVNFCCNHELQNLLLYGDAASAKNSARWLVLYRRTQDDFTESEANVLGAMWHHITRTIDINLNRALDHIDPHRTKRALGLVNSRGIIEIANQSLIDLLKVEWPLFNERSLPLPVINELINNGMYRGRKIKISASQKFGYLACTARCIPLIDTLAPSELNVADRFAKGMTHSEIAAHLRISPHTVRNQLAQVYQKLRIHSKVELVRAMSSRQA